ncbi:DNA polymerase IV [Methylocapsa acidiphila]|uniref:DNA polymerase IV n=1 Tax=Methylocapsa acidiphila TaxID=133552 RepID=UPI00047A4175|nr:DNA polymerase IV [Methylocapsa acidiphila]
MDQAFCRDCLVEQPAGAARCRSCGSPRVVAHQELGALTFAHVDCDAFYAAIEKRDDPSLRDRPVIIGGGKRGVVATACYVARTYGVHSAMPMFKALKACPDAAVVAPDMAKYARVARQIRALMKDLTPLVEPVSIDEAFLDLAGTEALHRAGAAMVLAGFAAKVEAQVGVTISIGLSYCKFLAKIASDLDKPRGFAIIGRAEAQSFLRPRPIGLIPGVGAKTQERLARDGFRLIGDLQLADEAALFARYGAEGQRMRRLALGIDARKISTDRETKSISAETTFETDLGALDELAPILYRLCEKLSARLKHAGLGTRAVTLKLKGADFKSRTRALSGLAATQLPNRLFAPARELLARELASAGREARFRLIGIGASDLCPAAEADQGDLVDTGLAREKAEDKAIDSLRAKFGPQAIVKGLSLRASRKRL